MRTGLSRTVSFAVWVTIAALTPGAAVSQTVEELAEQVRAAETAFAKTMADRDLDAFASHVADEAVFFGYTVLRGLDAVVEGWSPYFEGKDAPFSWEPEHVQVLESGTLALSSGPVFDPQGQRVGTFTSTWRLEADGPERFGVEMNRATPGDLFRAWKAARQVNRP